MQHNPHDYDAKQHPGLGKAYGTGSKELQHKDRCIKLSGSTRAATCVSYTNDMFVFTACKAEAVTRTCPEWPRSKSQLR